MNSIIWALIGATYLTLATIGLIYAADHIVNHHTTKDTHK